MARRLGFDRFRAEVLIDTAREAMRLIRESFSMVAGLNTPALALALPSGLVAPGTTALICNGSAVLASLNALRGGLR